MDTFVDRRLDGKGKSTPNREKLKRRLKDQIRKSLEKTMSDGTIADVDKGKVSIPARDLSEPTFQHARKGKWEIVHPGNREFIQGDTIPRPPGGNGSGGSGSGSASNSGEGEDEFVFTFSKEEFNKLFFDGLELPNLVKKDHAVAVDLKLVRAGFTSEGSPNNIDYRRTFRFALGRKFAILGARKRELEKLEDEWRLFIEQGVSEEEERIRFILQQIESIRARASPSFIEPSVDIRYRNRVLVPEPAVQAVMFPIMDVSGSMGEKEKDLAKRFFLLLYLFLKKYYEKVEIVFIRHHTTAKEVDEQEFFHGKETGGTVVSTALRLMADIVKKRYPVSKWNIYGAQASDGDDFASDVPICEKILLEELLPILRYYAYLEVLPIRHQMLWERYEMIQKAHSEMFAMRTAREVSEIYPIFRSLFEKKGSKTRACS